MNVNKTKVGIFAILVAFFMLCSVSASFASSSYGSNSFTVNDQNGTSSDIFTQLSANKNIFGIEKNKIPKKYKKYENYAFQVAKGAKIKYRASINTAGDGIVYNLKGTKVKSAYINFGNGKKVKTAGWVTQTYKKAGWYKITVKMNGTCTGFANLFYGGQDVNGTGEIINGTQTYLVYVADKPQLSLGTISAGYYSQKDYKKRNIKFLDIKVSNLGSKTSKATKLKVWYQDKKTFGKIHPKLKKFTKYATIKSLKPGKSTVVRVYFQVPKKYAKLVKNIKLDSSNRNKMISKANALYSFI